MIEQIRFQVGKSGVTPGVLESLGMVFKNHKQVRISVLKSSGRNKKNIPDMATDLSEGLTKITKDDYSIKIIGFTIILIKNSKKMKKQSL